MTDEERKNEAQEAAKRARAKKRELGPNPNGHVPVQARVEKIAKNPTDKELRKEAEKKEKADLKKMSKEERAVRMAQKKLEEAKKKLEEAKKLGDAKKIEKAKKLVEKSKKELAKAKENKRKKEQLNLPQIAKKEKATTDGMKKADDDIKKNPKNKEKDDQTKTKEAQKAKLADHIKLPSGLQIRQDGPNYVLVSQGKDGKEQTTPITDIMNEIDKYNKSVDAKNAAALAQSNVQKGVDDKAADAVKPGEKGVNTPAQAEGNAPVRVEPQATATVPEIPADQRLVAEGIAKDLGDGKIKPEDIKEVAQTAMELSKLGLIKDPHAIEKLNKRKKENEEKEQERLKAKQRAVPINEGRS